LNKIAQSGVTNLFSPFFKFFNVNQTKETKKNGRKGKFLSTFDTENMNKCIPFSKKQKAPINNNFTAVYICLKYDKDRSLNV